METSLAVTTQTRPARASLVLQRSVLGVAALLAVALMDIVSGPDYRFTAFYLTVVVVVAWSTGRRAGLLVATAASALSLVADLNGLDDVPAFAWNAATRVAMFIAAAWLVDARSRGMMSRLGRGASPVARLDAIAAGRDEERAIALAVVQRSATSVDECVPMVDDVVAAARRIRAHIKSGGKVLVCGNGGSAADAQHLVAELVGRFQTERMPLAAIALTANTSILTAVANDYSYGEVFARQVRALARSGDVLIGISTSGQSENVLKAFTAAPAGVLKVALTGRRGKLSELADVVLAAAGDSAAEIQAAHGVLIHSLCAVIETDLG